MSRKLKIQGYTLHSGIDLSQASWTSDASNVTGIDNFSYILQWTSLTGVGSVQVQGGIKDTQNNQGVIIWADLDFDAIPVENTNDTALINLSTLGFEYVRLVYTKDTASAGNLKVVVSANTVGA